MRMAPLWIAVSVTLLAAAYLPFRSLEDLPHAPLTEDGYYAMSVARNVALGKGLTYDGVHLSNGYQPLFTLLSVPAFALSGGDRYLALRIYLGLSWVVFAVTAFLLAAIARDLIPVEKRAQRAALFWLTAGLYVSSLAFKCHFNGMETGFLLFMLVLTGRFCQKRPLEEGRNLAILGALLGLCVLARIDCVYLVIFVSLWRLLPRRGVELARRVREFVVVSGTAFLVSSPWWAYNLYLTGSFMPTSGAAQLYRVFSPPRLLNGLGQWLREAVPWLPANLLAGHTAMVLQLLFALATTWVLWRTGRSQVLGTGSDHDASVRRTVQFGALLALTSLFLVCWYGLTSFAVWHYTRYFAPVLLVSLPATAYLLFLACARRALVVWLVALPLGLQVPLFIGQVCMSGLPLGDRLLNVYYEHQVHLVQSHVPDGERIAAAQSGTLGYFCELVTNLDGKVDPVAVLHRRDPRPYLESLDVHWFCDEPRAIPRFIGEHPWKKGWRLVDRSGGFVLFHRD